jgi:hypothetical protein
MHIRTFTENDLAQVLDLTIETFGPFFEESFRPLMGDLIYTNQHADWRDDYRREVPKLHDADQHKYVAGRCRWLSTTDSSDGSIWAGEGPAQCHGPGLHLLTLQSRPTHDKRCVRGGCRCGAGGWGG